jgi:hypothetical protein
LTVPYSGPPEEMTRQKFELLLQNRLEQLIAKDPKQAQKDLDVSPEYSPALYEIVAMGQPKEWPSQILASAPMQTLLDRINFQKGRSLSLAPSELPSLQEIAEAL